MLEPPNRVACRYKLHSPALEVVTSHQAQHTPVGNMSMFMHHHFRSITVLRSATGGSSGIWFQTLW